MSTKLTFSCNFCYKVMDVGWCKARLAMGKPTNSTMFSREWTQQLDANIKGPHICNNCAEDLVSHIKETN